MQFNQKVKHVPEAFIEAHASHSDRTTIKHKDEYPELTETVANRDT